MLLSVTVGCVVYSRDQGVMSDRVDLVGEGFSQWSQTLIVPKLIASVFESTHFKKFPMNLSTIDLSYFIRTRFILVSSL